MNEAINCEEILTRMVAVKLKIEHVIVNMDREDEVSVASSVGRKRQMKLPKIELLKFSGRLLDWLSWWAQFSKIHEDEELHSSDKFQYLIQSMKEGTKGAEIVKGFPATAENYPKAIAALQERFGRKKLLTQVYIRELFKMGIESMNSKSTISTIYDKLVCHIRSLESLNVTVEQASLFLYPMVEASLPEDVLVAWQRSSKYEQDGSAENPPKNELDYLLEFVQQEVELEEQRDWVKTGLDKSSVAKKRESVIQSAATLHVSNEKTECIFCHKAHASEHCGSAKDWSLEQKWKVINEERVCCKCLEDGHYGKNCKKSISCELCSKSHYKIMCARQ